MKFNGKLKSLPAGAAVFAFLALAGLLGMLAVQAVMAQSADQPPAIANPTTDFDYNEGSDAAVVTYTARDPESRPIFWTLGGVDAADFTIDGGSLRFMNTPDYENPTDRDEDLVTADDQRAGDNTYRVTVRVSAGGEDGAPGDTNHVGDDVATVDVTVNVINVNEEGEVTISPMQPQVGTMLTPTLTDPDNLAPGVGDWQWASSDSKSGPFTDIPNLSNMMTYQPTEDDLDKYLRVTVRYVDRAGGTPEDPRILAKVTDYPVRKDIVTSNQPPKFPDQRTLGLAADTGSSFARGTTERFIREDADQGDYVGAPVTAFDDATAIEGNTYSLRDVTATVDDDTNPYTSSLDDGHARGFDIDAVTGQIMVGANAMLDADATDATNPYNVVVRAVDPDGDTMDINVTIRVVGVNEPPMIDRVYQTGRVDTSIATISVGGRVPTEISHTELDRVNAPATRLDTNLDNGVLYTTPAGTGDPAIYAASDPDDGDTASLSVGGDDGELFELVGTADDGTTDLSPDTLRRLAFKKGPNWEDPKDANKDNVYEVTIIATDGEELTDELPVTVKVINSTEDNKAGEVEFSNRVPEVASALTAKLDDDDMPTREVKWQWYRAEEASTSAATACANRAPETNADADIDANGNRNAAGIDTVNQRRYFVENDGPYTDGTTGWIKIDGATSDTYTPGYNAAAGGTRAFEDNTTGTGNDRTGTTVETWSGGDITRIATTTYVAASGNNPPTATTVVTWSAWKCLRATVTYRDAVDRTYSAGDSDSTDDVDETLEATWLATERPVKGEDKNNDTPVFTDNGQLDGTSGLVTGNPVSVYRAERAENTTADTTPSLIITEALAAVDTSVGEDDQVDQATPTYAEADNDLLTYTLGGPDAESFIITGTVDYNSVVMPAQPTDTPPGLAGIADGRLSFKSDVELDYETKREYRVNITATDPSKDNNSVTVEVIVTITNVNEGPEWTMNEDEVMYKENGTDPVSVYRATDPERSGINYYLVTAATDTTDPDVTPAITTEQVGADHAKFTIGSVDGILRFKSSPNFEKPDDAGTPSDNTYVVTVRAEVADDENPRHITIQQVTVTVTNVNEAPVFSKTTDTLEITENPDDLQKEPPLAEGYLYLLNRGVGKPTANLPLAPNLDVGIPVVAIDDDSTSTFAIGGYTDTTQDRIDGLTYSLSGDGAGTIFDIVEATGQILTLGKLDFETKKTYNVMVTATDPWDAQGSIPVTINVTDVDEVPVSGVLTLSGSATPDDFAENGVDTTVGSYTVSGVATAVTWSLEGADASHFTLECPIDPCPNPNAVRTRDLKFASSPNYEMPRGEAMSDTNTNTYMVTVKAEAGSEMQMVAVTVMVTNVEEAGMVELSATGGKVGTPLTAELTDDDIVMGAIEWLWSRVDPVSGSTVPITGARSASYTPVPADVGSLLMVTATYTDGIGAGKTVSASITIPVEDANVAPEFATATDTREVAENMPSGTLAGTPITATDANGDVITYGLAGADAANFSIDSATGQVETAASFNYEAKSSHAITVTATDPDGATGSIAVTVNVTNVDEVGMVTVSPAQPSVGTRIMASVTDPDSTPTGVTWQWSYATAMGGPFTLYPGETTAVFTPAAADVNRYLRITAVYNDGFAAQTQSHTTGMVAQNNAPAFASAAETRSVAENTASGMAIGQPVTATDADNDTLEYSLSGTDAAAFGINMSTGQLMTRAALDYETRMTYTVMVMATDPYGAYASTTVTIMVTDVDEDPSQAIIAKYDSTANGGNGNGRVDIAEILNAIDDYRGGRNNTTIAEILTLIDTYRNQAN